MNLSLRLPVHLGECPCVPRRRWEIFFLLEIPVTEQRKQHEDRACLFGSRCSRDSVALGER